MSAPMSAVGGKADIEHGLIALTTDRRRYRTARSAEFRPYVHIVKCHLTFGEHHPRLFPSRPLRGAFMRRREGGAGCGTRGCGSQLHPRADPGRTPSATIGPPGSGHRETRKRKDVAWRADLRGSLLLPRLLGAPTPSLGEGKRDGLSPSPTKAGASIALATHRGRAMRVAAVSVRPRGSGGPVIDGHVCLALGPRLRGDERGRRG